MNDRYKFRGKRKSSRKKYQSWIYGFVFFDEDGTVQILYNEKNGDISNEDVIPNTVGQYTGLKDKNGVEIYEGDVVNMHYFFENYHPSSLGIFEDEKEIIGTVGIDECGTYTESDSEIYYWFNYLQDPNEELEVIGNIHDNPN